jgi:hypothetical protein
MTAVRAVRNVGFEAFVTKNFNRAPRAVQRGKRYQEEKRRQVFKKIKTLANLSESWHLGGKQ